MGQFLDLQMKLSELMEGNMVKFQPPPGYQLTYPCLVYNISSGTTRFAENMPYLFTRRYTLTLMDRNPDSIFFDRIAKAFPMITVDRCFSTQGIHHFVYTLYY